MWGFESRQAAEWLPPKLFEAGRVRRRVFDGMLNLPVSEVILNEPRIRALVGKGEAASVAQHVRMGKQGLESGGAVFSQAKLDGRAVQRLPLLADKERLAGRLHPGAFFQPCADGPQLVAS